MFKSKVKSIRSILLIESNAVIAMDIVQVLQNIGYKVEVAKDRTEGLDRMKQNEHGLIILSGKIQGNGEKFYKEVLALNRDLTKKIMFISGNITDFIKSTGNPYLMKPFSDEQLIEAVKNIIS